ncbi:MAG: hypothetical protein ABSG65_30265 [Bryobacteraceae bacterium]|jgi:hypothetical protein
MFNFLGNLASLFGLVFSFLAFVFAKSASTAARQARNAMMRQSLSKDMSSAARTAGEVDMYLRTDRREMALLRISDLINQTGYLNGRWEDRLPKKSKDNLFRAVGQLRSMHAVLSVARELIPEDQARLARSCQEVSEIFSMEHGAAARVAEAGEEQW